MSFLVPVLLVTGRSAVKARGPAQVQSRTLLATATRLPRPRIRRATDRRPTQRVGATVAYQAPPQPGRRANGMETELAGRDPVLRAATQEGKTCPPGFDDHAQPQLRTEVPNRVSLNDITEHGTSTEGRLYCCAIKDVFSNRIVRYSISDRMISKLAVDALHNAVARAVMFPGESRARTGEANLEAAPAQELRRRGMESFWSLLRTNVLNRERCATRRVASRDPGLDRAEIPPLSRPGQLRRLDTD